DEGQDDVNEQTDSDNDGDDFVHPKFSTPDEEDDEEKGLDLRVQTPSYYESTNDKESDEVTHGANVEEEELDEEETNEEDEANELYRDVNVNLEGRDTEMTDAPCTIIQTTQVIENTHVIITPVNPEAVSLIPGIIDAYLANKMHEAVKTAAANLSELELKKILIDKMESNKSIHRSDEQKNLYKALVDTYESDKLILDTYGDTVTVKRRRDDEDKDEEPSAGSNWEVQEKKSWKRTRVNQCTKGKDLQDNWQVY
ncbi:hypothetical protein Tco_1557954, partial [Tanacetum coccineum]